MQTFHPRPVLTTTLTATLLLLGTLLTAPVVRADRDDHDRARAALERGEIMPIALVLAAAEVSVPGDVIEIELEDERGGWVYELKVIAPDGRLRKVYLDGATAEVLHEKDYRNGRGRD